MTAVSLRGLPSRPLSASSIGTSVAPLVDGVVPGENLPAMSAAWGSIGGTLSAQTDLQAALNGKQPSATVLTNTTAAFTTAQESKLAGIAPGATANASDAALINRANHTGTQLAATISDFTEATQDVIGAMVAAAGGSYDDGAGTITLPGAGSPGVLASSVATLGTPASTVETSLISAPYVMPANTLNATGASLRIEAAGTMAATTRSRTIRVKFGSYTFSFVSTTSTHVNWVFNCLIVRESATAQRALWDFKFLSSSNSPPAVGALNSGSALLTETLTSDVTINLTGQVAAGAVANDIVCRMMLVEKL